MTSLSSETFSLEKKKAEGCNYWTRFVVFELLCLLWTTLTEKKKIEADGYGYLEKVIPCKYYNLMLN